MCRFLEAATDPGEQPVFVHCRRGGDRKGVTVAVYRVCLAGWTKEDATAEMMTAGFHSIPAGGTSCVTSETWTRNRCARGLGVGRTNRSGKLVSMRIHLNHARASCFASVPLPHLCFSKSRGLECAPWHGHLGKLLSLVNSLEKSAFCGNSATSSVNWVRASSVFFSRSAASASKIFANGRR
jgi:hypothetical protein